MDPIEHDPEQVALLVLQHGLLTVINENVRQALIFWIFVSWFGGAMIMFYMAIFNVLGWPLQTGITNILIAAGFPAPNFGRVILAMMATVWIRLLIIPDPSYLRCLNIFRPRPLFSSWGSQVVHSLSAIATYVVTMQLVTGLFYLMVAHVKMYRQDMSQLEEGEPVYATYYYILCCVWISMISQFISGCAMLGISFLQVLRIEDISRAEIFAIICLTNLMTRWVYAQY
ncbi:hypothetical protein ABKA04_001340 [Annulohypoxylon sp. FPYF3050]